MNRTQYRSKKYLDWIRTQRCCVTGRHENIVAHHVTVMANRGVGQKPCDFWAIPLEYNMHEDLHQHGEKSFWMDQRLNPHKVITSIQKRYISRETDQSFEFSINNAEFLSSLNDLLD